MNAITMIATTITTTKAGTMVPDRLDLAALLALLADPMRALAVPRERAERLILAATDTEGRARLVRELLMKVVAVPAPVTEPRGAEDDVVDVQEAARLVHRLPKLWIHYPGKDGKTEREPTHTTSIVAARKLRAKRLEQHGRGEAGRAAERIRVDELLTDYQTDAEVNRRASLKTIIGHVKLLTEALGHLRAIDCTTDRVQAVQREWQRAGLPNSTINRRCASLRRAFVLGVRAGKLYVVPYIPRLAEDAPRGRYLTPGDADAIEAQLPEYVRPPFRFAVMYGTRKGQLARTQRRYVDLDRCVIEWPASECKKREAHVVPLDGDGLALVEQLMDDARPWCPYLFHGPDCAPGHAPSKVYGCLGDFKKAWRTACKAAGFPVGRANGGFVLHHTRNTAATNLRAGGWTRRTP